MSETNNLQDTIESVQQGESTESVLAQAFDWYITDEELEADIPEPPEGEEETHDEQFLDVLADNINLDENYEDVEEEDEVE